MFNPINTLPLRVVLTVPFVILILVTSTLIGYLTFQNSQSADAGTFLVQRPAWASQVQSGKIEYRLQGLRCPGRSRGMESAQRPG